MSPHSHATWVLVCNASRARVFGVINAHRPWVQLQALVHPGSRVKGADLMSDRPGHAQASARPGNQTIMTPHVEPKEAEAQRFADTLVEELEQGLSSQSFQQVVLVAPPHFLGLLRQRLGEQVAQRVAFTVAKDYTSLTDAELPAHLISLRPSGEGAPSVVL